MSREDYEEYKEGFEAGENAVEERAIQDIVNVWMGRYSDKSEVWWKGFEDGKEGNWDPPSGEDGVEQEEQEA